RIEFLLRKLDACRDVLDGSREAKPEVLVARIPAGFVYVGFAATIRSIEAKYDDRLASALERSDESPGQGKEALLRPPPGRRNDDDSSRIRRPEAIYERTDLLVCAVSVADLLD